jgi:hypothetical protein
MWSGRIRLSLEGEETHVHSHQPVTARARVAAPVMAVGLLAAACSGSSDASSGVASIDEGRDAGTPDGNDTDDAPLDEHAQALVFAECRRDNGVDMPDPGPVSRA